MLKGSPKLLDGIPALPPADGPSSEVIDVTPGSHSEAAGRLLGRGSMPIRTAIHRVAERGARTQDLHGEEFTDRTTAEDEEAREHTGFLSASASILSPSPSTARPRPSVDGAVLLAADTRNPTAGREHTTASEQPIQPLVSNPSSEQPIAVCGT